MKTSFHQQDRTLLFTLLTLGAVTTGTLSWLCLTSSGKKIIKCRVKDLAAALVCHETGFAREFVRPAVDAIID